MSAWQGRAVGPSASQEWGEGLVSPRVLLLLPGPQRPQPCWSFFILSDVEIYLETPGPALSERTEQWGAW